MLIGEKGNRDYALIKVVNTFMFHHTLHRGRKHFSHYCLQVFSSEEIVKVHIKDCFNISGKQRIIMPKKRKFFLNSKTMKEK